METTIFRNITVEDADLVGDALDVVCVASKVSHRHFSFN